jgi:hypothetical protein
VIDRAVGEAALSKRRTVCLCLRPGFFDRIALDQLCLRVAPDLSRRDLAKPVLCEERKEMVDERPAEIGDRLGLESFLFALCEPLGGVLVERRFLEPCVDWWLVSRRLPDTSADVREDVREFLLRPLPGPAVLTGYRASGSGAVRRRGSAKRTF